jgi:hypothetical protein
MEKYVKAFRGIHFLPNWNLGFHHRSKQSYKVFKKHKNLSRDIIAIPPPPRE